MWKLLIPCLLALTSCGLPSSGGACNNYDPWFLECSDGYVEKCDSSSGCDQCGCVPVEDTRPGGPQG